MSTTARIEPSQDQKQNTKQITRRRENNEIQQPNNKKGDPYHEARRGMLPRRKVWRLRRKAKDATARPKTNVTDGINIPSSMSTTARIKSSQDRKPNTKQITRRRENNEIQQLNNKKGDQNNAITPSRR